MTDFYAETEIKRTRKPHVCRCCDCVIAAGLPAISAAGVWNGDFARHYLHIECKAAGDAYAHATRNWGEDYVWLAEGLTEGMLGASDMRWLRDKHPVVAARLEKAGR